ncbi:MAG: BspA family leucine-rich repeat surface protein, partial [Anaeroplasmataceae bacterium]
MKYVIAFTSLFIVSSFFTILFVFVSLTNKDEITFIEPDEELAVIDLTDYQFKTDLTDNPEIKEPTKFLGLDRDKIGFIYFGTTIPHGVGNLTDKVDITVKKTDKVHFSYQTTEQGTEDSYNIYITGKYLVAPTNASYMFYNMKELRDIEGLKLLNTKYSTDMSYMFTDCEKLRSLDVSKFDTSNVTNMTRMFDSCKELTKIDLSNFETSFVTDMSFMFSMCVALTELDITNFETPLV